MINNIIPENLTTKSLIAMTKYWQQANQDQGIAEQHLAGAGAVFQLETKLKNYYQKKYALCVSNATTGLLAIALALNLKQKEFITTPYTYGASLAGFLLLENKPLFAQVDAQTLTLDPESIKAQITPNTRAILAVDIYGNPCNQEALRNIADQHGIWYIADAAQSLGGYRGGIPASSLADVLVVSFTVGKSIFAGEGGAILTDNEELYQKLVWFTQHPYRQKRDLGLFLTNEFALNSRIHPLSAVIANAIFEDALIQLKLYQNWCFEVINAVNKIGLTKQINFQFQEIIPTFFSLVFQWDQEAKEIDLLRQLEQFNLKVNLESLTLKPLFEHPAFLETYGHLFNNNQSKNIKINGDYLIITPILHKKLFSARNN
jgi:perosamine synthetase